MSKQNELLVNFAFVVLAMLRAHVMFGTDYRSRQCNLEMGQRSYDEYMDLHSCMMIQCGSCACAVRIVVIGGAQPPRRGRFTSFIPIISFRRTPVIPQCHGSIWGLAAFPAVYLDLDNYNLLSRV